MSVATAPDTATRDRPGPLYTSLPDPLPPADPTHVNALSRKAKIKATRERRRKVWALKISGAPIPEIARVLGITEKAVKGHIARATAYYRQAIDAKIVASIEQEIARYDAIVASLWSQRGNPRVADSITRAMEGKARLLGLNAPTKTEISGPGGRPIAVEARNFDPTKLSTEQLDTLIATLEAARADQAIDVTPPKQALAEVKTEG